MRPPPYERPVDSDRSCEFCQISDARSRNGNDFNHVILKNIEKALKELGDFFDVFDVSEHPPLLRRDLIGPRGMF